MNLRVNFNRLKEDILSLAAIGRDPRGGLSRPSFSQADLEARQWLKNKIKQAGLFLRQDGAGNIFGRLGGEGKVVMAGSHLDTVINGGPFDGSVGVISALECLRRIKEEGLNLAKPLEVASFSDEEGNLVGDFLGSRAFVGSLEKEKLEKSLTQFGTTLVDILARTEFTIETILQAHRQRPDIEAFIELHIEQGTVLESEDKTIGIVEKIAGKQYRWCSFEGKASHAGTTPFELRHDAFLGLADFALKTTQYVATNYYGSLLTIGKVAVSPGSFSIVPARADFSLDFRSTSSQILIELEKYTQALAQDIASTRGLKFNSLLQDKTEPVMTSKRLTSIISEECQKLGYSFLRLSSGAGHDAQILATVTDSAMIFIPCVDGLSHSPQENINWDDLEKGANLLLQVLIRLAS